MRVFLHLGVPKTASTSLQRSLFQRLHDGRVTYIGKRDINSDVYNELLFYINSATDEKYAKDFELFAQRLHDYCSSFQTDIIVSDESFLVPSITEFGFVETETKLRRLLLLFSGYQVNVILFVRNQVSALYSLYVELYDQLKVVDLGDVNSFLGEDGLCYFDVFDYRKIFELLHRSDFVRDIKIFLFEEFLADKQKSVYELCRYLGVSWENDFELAHENAKTKTELGVICEPVTLKRRLELLIVTRCSSLFSWLGKGKIRRNVARKLWGIITVFASYPVGRGVRIPYLTDGQKKQVYDYYSLGNIELSRLVPEVRVGIERYGYPG